ncbi:MAG: hypothetical protein Q8882_05585 [Bacillota bacterium]|nr:hypothetical protein [Bacillota bacterium]
MIKRLLTIIVAFLLVFSVFVPANSLGAGISTSEGFKTGTGTANDPYLVTNLSELTFLSKSVSDGISYKGQYFLLTADLKLNDTSHWRIWETDAPSNSFAPIGKEKRAFEGSFDGGGHTISGIYINSYSSCQGLFGCIDGGTVKNVNVAESYISGNDNVGSVVGLNSGRVENCSSNAVINGGSKIGGVAGYNYSGHITNCLFEGEVYAESSAGGITGYSYNSSILGCANKGCVYAESYLGGIAGYNNTSLITDCYNISEIKGGNDVGGIAGVNVIEDSKVLRCYNKGDIEGAENIGGITGINYGTVDSCFNIGTVTGTGVYGGLVGRNSPQNENDDLPENGKILNCCYSPSKNSSGVGYTIDDIDLEAEEVKSERFYSESFNVKYMNFVKFVSPENLKTDEYSLWIFPADSLPILYWQAENTNEDVKGKDNTPENQNPDEGSAKEDTSIKIGTKIKEVLYTDIKAYICGHEIESYNVDGYTAVVVEDLRNYGFNVEWDEKGKCSKVTYSKGEITSSYKSSDNKHNVGEYAMDVLYTDIVTYINDKKVDSFNVNGRTIIFIKSLGNLGKVTFNEKDKAVYFE